MINFASTLDNPGFVVDYAMCYFVKSDEYLDEVRSLLAGGEDPNQVVYGSSTLLHVAAQSESVNYRVVQTLINAGADVNSINKLGYTPLQLAVIRRKRKVVDELINSGAQINTKNFLSRTALHYSVSSTQYSELETRHLDAVSDIWIMQKLLTHKDIDVNPVDLIGETPLMWAVLEQQFPASGYILYKGANASIPNIDLDTPLHLALSAEYTDENILCSLFAYGASIYSVNKQGQSPLDILAQRIEQEGMTYIARVCIKFVALKYHHREDLQRKLGQNPATRHYLTMCCSEVQMMKRHVIYDNITVHDFIFDCFQARTVGNVVRNIYKPVVQILFTGMYDVYFEEILFRMSKHDLFNVLASLLPSRHFFSSWVVNDLVSSYLTHYELFRMIAACFNTMNSDRLWNIEE